MSITIIIVIITCGISIVAFSNHKYMNDLIFYPPAISERKQYYRLFTHALIHADVAHLAFNMLALYSFGDLIEKYIFSSDCMFGTKGKFVYLVMYILAAVIASMPTYIKHKHDYHYRSLGASGAVSAVIFSGLVLMPQIPIRFMFIPIDIPGYIFGPAYLGISYYLSRKEGGTVNHSAHYWGAVFGIAFTVAATLIWTNVPLKENFVNQIKVSPKIISLDGYCGGE